MRKISTGDLANGVQKWEIGLFGAYQLPEYAISRHNVYCNTPSAAFVLLLSTTHGLQRLAIFLLASKSLFLIPL